MSGTVGNTPAWRSPRGIQRALVAAAVVLFVARGLDVGAAFNHTFDEPTQIASGLELLQYGTFALHADVPPLAKLLIAAPAYAAGVRLPHAPQRGDWQAANRALYESGQYWFVLRSARAVNTAVGALVVIAVALLAASLFGGWAVPVAAFVAASSPGLISAGSIANSDILGVLTVVCAFYAFRRLLQTGARREVILFAVAVAAALATKLSAVPFFVFGMPVVAIFTLRGRLFTLVRAPRALVRAVAPVVALLVLVVPIAVWAAYGFRLAAPIGPQEAARVGDALRQRAGEDVAATVTTLAQTPVPLGSFIRGVGVGYKIAKQGHPAYLMGIFSLHGWPHYFLVTLLLKVPLGILAAASLSFLIAVVRRRTPHARETLLAVTLCGAILASVAGAGINAGHRHVVAIEALLALAVAGGVAITLSESRRTLRLATAALLTATLAGGVASLRAQPDLLGYTNTMAGSEPDWWFIDSNLDWGQDLERLRTELDARGVRDEIRLAYFGTADPTRHGIHFEPLQPGERACGWVAVSINYLRGLAGSGVGLLGPESHRNGYRWLLDQVPVAQVGTSIRLYRVPPAGGHDAATCSGGRPVVREDARESALAASGA